MASFYLRGDRIYFRVRTESGEWKSIRSSFVRGQEKAARKALVGMDAMSAARAKLVPLADGQLTLRRYSSIWLDERRKAGVVDWLGEKSKLRDHVLPYIGDMELNAIRPKHLADLMKLLAEKKKPIGRKTRCNVYGVIKSLLRDAKLADLFLGEDPCILPPSAFGIEHEKDPEWRSKAIFARAELVTLITNENIPLNRRVFYAVQGIGMGRLGEPSALLVRNIDLDRKPLGCMLFPRSHEREWTKGRGAREVPIHPVLHDLLKEWLEHGWEKMMGYPPGPDDLVFPLPPEDAARRRDDPDGEPRRSKSYSYKRFKGDLEALGLRHRREHDLRRTGISLLREDGASKDILETITHNPLKKTIDLYTTYTWETKCSEILKLKLDMPPTGGSADPAEGSMPTALVKAGTDVAAAGLATRFATSDRKSEGNQSLVLWRRRVLPPGPEGLSKGRYVRSRRFESRVRIGPPTGRPGRQPSLSVAT